MPVSQDNLGHVQLVRRVHMGIGGVVDLETIPCQTGSQWILRRRVYSPFDLRRAIDRSLRLLAYRGPVRAFYCIARL